VHQNYVEKKKKIIMKDRWYLEKSSIVP